MIKCLLVRRLTRHPSHRVHACYTIDKAPHSFAFCSAEGDVYLHARPKFRTGRILVQKQGEGELPKRRYAKHAAPTFIPSLALSIQTYRPACSHSSLHFHAICKTIGEVLTVKNSESRPFCDIQCACNYGGFQIDMVQQLNILDMIIIIGSC